MPSNPTQRSGLVVLTIIAALVVIVPLFIFSSVVRFEFVQWDDAAHLTANKLYQPTPLAHLADFWTRPYFGAYVPISCMVWGLLADSSVTPNGQPTTTFDPSKYHLANLYIHAANVLLVFFILRLLLALAGAGGSEVGAAVNRKDWAAALGALLFAVHPLQVEPVAWVSGLRDLLCAFFSLACLLFYLVAIRGEASDPKGGWWLLGASACYVLALLSKSSAVSVPLILLLIDYALSRNIPKGRLWMLGAWLAPAIVVSLVTKHAESLLAGRPPYVPLWQRPFVAGDTIGFYLWKLFVPHPLGVDYSRTPTWVMSHAWAYLPVLVPIALIVLAWRFWKRAPWLAAAIGIFLISLAPVSGIVPFNYQMYSTVADRYMYFAMLAPALAFAGILSLVPWRAAAAAGAVVLVCLGYLAVRQVPVWTNSTTLFTHGRQANPRSFVCYTFLGIQEQGASDYGQAVADYRLAAGIAPDNWVVQFRLGHSLFLEWAADGSRPQEIGMLQEAEQHLLATLVINTRYWPAHQDLGKIYDRMDRYRDALSQFQTAAEAAPDDPENNYMLALAYSRQGNMSHAMPYMQRAAAMGYAPAVQALAPGGQQK